MFILSSISTCLGWVAHRLPNKTPVQTPAGAQGGKPLAGQPQSDEAAPEIEDVAQKVYMELSLCPLGVFTSTIRGYILMLQRLCCNKKRIPAAAELEESLRLSLLLRQMKYKLLLEKPSGGSRL